MVVWFLLLLAMQPALADRPGRAENAGPSSRPFRVLRDQVYARVAGRQLLLDLYLPSNVRKPVPVVMYIHGGDWMYGNRGRPPVLFLLEEGIAVASIDYRMAPGNRFPAQIQDCRDALLYLKSNGKRYGLAEDHIGLLGESAGGHLAALLGTAADEKAFIGLRKAPADARVQAVCAVSGPMDIEYLGTLTDAIVDVIGKHPIQQLLGGTIEQKLDLAILASPIRHVSKQSPPFLLVFGDRDLVVPPILNRDMYEALKDAGVDVRAYEVKGMGHNMLRIWDEQTRGQIATFFRERLLELPPPADAVHPVIP